MSEQLRPQSLPDVLYVALREAILSLELSPGTRVTEAFVADKYRVARPTARAVIEQLTGVGLLSRSSHKSAYVPIFSPEDIVDIYESRMAMEREVVRSLAEDALVPAGAQEQIDTLRRAAPDAGGLQSIAPDLEFHRLLVEATGRRRLLKAYLGLMGEAQLCMAHVAVGRLLDSATIVEEHQGILTSIADGDGDEAARRLTDHLRLAEDVLVQAVRTDREE